MEDTATYRMLVLLSILLQMISANAQMYGGAWPGVANVSPYMASLATAPYNMWGGVHRYASLYQNPGWGSRALPYNTHAFKTWNHQPEQATSWSNAYNWGQIPDGAYPGNSAGRYPGNPYSQWIDGASPSSDPTPDVPSYDSHSSYKEEPNILQSWPHNAHTMQTTDRSSPEAFANAYKNAYKEVMRAYVLPSADSSDDSPIQPHAHPSASAQHAMKFPAYPGASPVKKEPNQGLRRRSATGAASATATAPAAADAAAATGASAADGASRE